MSRILLTSAVLAAALGVAGDAPAGSFISPNFSGVSEIEGWDNLTASNPQIASSTPPYPSFPTADEPWPAPIVPTAAGSAGSAVFDKMSGGGFPSGGSIYNSFTQGGFEVSDSSPIPGLETVLFQLELGAGVENFFGSPQFQNSGWFSTDAGSRPVLNFNGGSQALAPILDASFVGSRPFPSPFPGIPGGTTQIFAFQWDLTGLGPITSYDIAWTSIELGSNFAMQLDTSDTFSPVVPEPACAAACVLVAALAVGRRRR